MAGSGTAWRGWVGHGVAGHGGWICRKLRRGVAGQGAARLGVAGPGGARQGVARRGLAGHGAVRRGHGGWICKETSARPGPAGSG